MAKFLKAEIAAIATTEKNPERHRGRTVEYVVRRSPLGISEISRRIGISRRSLYNWFENEKLDINQITQVGAAINYDFSKDFPVEIYETELSLNEYLEVAPSPANGEISPVYYWMEKYIHLLEEFNKRLHLKGRDTSSGISSNE
ncbi:hypothetical protein DIU31_003205 [Mucilaginibacter rubeus]|uniref:Helix-turn-helix domain-containing protein n=1 Tax=Mucilaginibacter rubeus TaxID=2027860 RepID=A0AAE6MGJ3_9SPHI|nr:MULTISPECIES: hypothetical protein [Mucilaginibacter]QEM02571.1 hypothetical protein DIU31_003205 [Mucilaginibacter rubeus]QEM15190.1 hypothetical protein DIU38_003235 [Mucilaginibacter gossypii]QTE42086.1 hypothetical protein J3L19_24570 [Mucilaginibacter rubeus]QTE48687.1 hypothetical protein J3L21_24545 [Mucilaginibacter rubeus]QTE60073.1 hypothetical protein J3L23_16175 [Mucilaginibacter rubeus]